MTYRELQAVLDRMSIAVGAAEAHGWLCGALCVRETYGAPEWLRELAADAGAAAADPTEGQSLLAVHEETLAALRSPDFDFAPLLPGDETALRERVAALASWCDGFLYGIGTAASGREIMKEGDLREFLSDLTDIARAELEAGRSAEAGERDYAELHEFVRAGVQLTWDQLAEAKTHATG
ncbi:MAG: UPF0149 family protein [Steroidobacteraceae bacterium]